MKTLTIKNASLNQNFPKTKLLVDGKQVGSLSKEDTQYFEIPMNAKNVSLDLFWGKSNSLDISENQHHAIAIKSSKNQNSINLLLLFSTILALNLLDIQLWAIILAAVISLIIYYFVYRNKEVIRLEYFNSN